METFVIEYIDSDGQEALAKFMAWSEDIGEKLRFVRFVDGDA